MPTNNRAPNRCGLTLVEVLVIVLIIAILVGLFFPAVRRVRGPAMRMQSQNNLKQLGLACHSYHSEQGYFPPMIGHVSYGKSKDAFGTVFFHLLPYLEHNSLFKKSWDENTQQYNVHNNGVAGVALTKFINSGDPSINEQETVDGEALSSYAANMQVFGKTRKTARGSIEPERWQVYANLRETFDDGVENTILISEKYARCGTGGTRWGHTKSNRFVPTFAAYSRQKFQAKPDPETECHPHLASSPWSEYI